MFTPIRRLGMSFSLAWRATSSVGWTNGSATAPTAASTLRKTPTTRWMTTAITSPGMDEWLSDRAHGGFYASQDADYSMDDDGDYFTWDGRMAQRPRPRRLLRFARRRLLDG